jgi:hypothetical protein
MESSCITNAIVNMFYNIVYMNNYQQKDTVKLTTQIGFICVEI